MLISETRLGGNGGALPAAGLRPAETRASMARPEAEGEVATTPSFPTRNLATNERALIAAKMAGLTHGSNRFERKAKEVEDVETSSMVSLSQAAELMGVAREMGGAETPSMVSTARAFHVRHRGAPIPSLPDAFSRRAALFGAVTVAGFAAAGSAAKCRAASPLPDDELIVLALRLEALAVREREAWKRHSEAEDAAVRATPPAPVRREVPGPYAGVEALSAEERYAKLFAPPVDFWAASAAADVEHRAALEEHARTVEAIEKLHRVPVLERKACRLTDELTEASGRLAAIQAATVAGLGAKARVLLALAGGDWLSRPAELERHGALLESLLADAVRLGTGVLS